MRRRVSFFVLLSISAVAGLASSRREKEVRHELGMLPFHGIFDDLALRMDGPKIQFLGAVTQPALKSDAYRAIYVSTR